MAEGVEKPGSAEIARVLHVTLDSLSLHESHNYFCMVSLNEGLMPGGAKQRTEVSRVTDKPVFSSAAFQFTSTVEWAENQAELVVSVMEVVHGAKVEGKKGSAKPYGTCSVNLAQQQAALEAGDLIRCTMEAFPADSTECCGQISLKLQLKDAQGPAVHASLRPPSGASLRVTSPTYDASSNLQYLSIQVRSAVNLPMSPEGDPPSVYVAAKTREQEERNISGAPQTSLVSGTRNPVWNQTLVLECQPGTSAVVLALVNDEASLLRKVEVPLDKLTVAQRYNLDLSLPPGDVRLQVQLCLHSLAEPPRFLKENPEMMRVEATLGALTNKLLVPSGEVVAVLQLVANEDSFVASISRSVRNKATLPSLPLRAIKSASSWETLAETLTSSRQASSAVNGDGVVPVWGERFTFTQQRKEVAGEHAALAIELFQRQGGLSSVDEVAPGGDKMKLIGFATQRLGPLFNDPRILNEGIPKTFDSVRVHLLGLPPSAVSVTLQIQRASQFVSGLRRLASTLTVLPADGADEAERRAMFQNLCRLDLPLPAAIRATTAPMPPGVHGGGSLVSHSTHMPGSHTVASRGEAHREWHQDANDASSEDPETVQGIRHQLQERDMNIAVYRAQIADMREREAGLLEEINRARQQAEHAKNVPMNASGLEELDREELERRFGVLLRNYQTERRENEKLAKWLKQLRGEMKHQQSGLEEHKALQQAHVKQGEAMKRLGEENTRLLKCKAAMKDQEQVILKLEDLLDSAVRKQQEREAEMQLVAPDLQLKLEEAHKVIEQLQDDLGTALAAGPADPVHPASSELGELEHNVAMWRAKAEVLQTRVQEVEAALESLPKQWGSEMAKLQIQLKEKDAQLAGGFGSLTNLKMGTNLTPAVKPALSSADRRASKDSSGSADRRANKESGGSARRGSSTPKEGAGASGPGLEPIRGGSAGSRKTPLVEPAWSAEKAGDVSAALGSAYERNVKKSSPPARTPPIEEPSAPTPPVRSREQSAVGSRPGSSRRNSRQSNGSVGAGGEGRPETGGKVKDKPWSLDAQNSTAAVRPAPAE